MIRRPPRSTLSSSSAASDVYKRQGSMFPISLMNEDFMTFLTSAFVLITLGIWLVKDFQKQTLIGALYLTLLISIVYMVSLKMDVWVLLMGVVVEIGFVW